MRVVKKNMKAVLLLATIAAVVCIGVVLVRPSYAGMNANTVIPISSVWLSQYVGHTVRVTFVSAPSYLGTDLQKTSSLSLIEVGQAGIVVSFRPSRTVFFSYSQIAAIEPIYRTN